MKKMNWKDILETIVFGLFLSPLLILFAMLLPMGFPVFLLFAVILYIRLEESFSLQYIIAILGLIAGIIISILAIAFSTAPIGPFFSYIALAYSAFVMIIYAAALFFYLRKRKK